MAALLFYIIFSTCARAMNGRNKAHKRMQKFIKFKDLKSHRRWYWLISKQEVQSPVQGLGHQGRRPVPAGTECTQKSGEAACDSGGPACESPSFAGFDVSGVVIAKRHKACSHCQNLHKQRISARYEGIPQTLGWLNFGQVSMYSRKTEWEVESP